MNRILFFFFCMLFFVAAKGQRNYAEALRQGDEARDKGKFDSAINKYFAAEAFDPTKKDTVKARVKTVFDAIDDLRKKAENDKARAETAEKLAIGEKRKTDIALKIAEAAKVEAFKSDSTTKIALAQSQKLINAFYFYKDRFALAFKDGLFYFIDKNGEEITKLGKWEKAEQFEQSGFAKVKKNYDFNKVTTQTFTDSAGNVIRTSKIVPKIVVDDTNDILIDHILDTSGNSYPAAFDFNSNNDHKLKVRIKALDLTSKHLDSFPLNVLGYDDLQVLILNGWLNWHNNFIAIPSEIKKLRNLINLQLEACSIKNLPNEIGELKDLTKLILGYNELDSLPKEIGELKNLTTLDLKRNNLDRLPNEIGKLKNLTSLDLSGNQLNNLPAEISELKYLETLNLKSNNIITLPKEIGELKNLTFVDLYFNQLTRLPKEIGQLKNLREFRLSTKKLDSLPVEIGQLKNLTILDLEFNLLTSLPKEIVNLVNLTYLNLYRNRLTKLPKEIGQLKNLTMLDLEANPLTSLPKEIGQLKNLIYLNLAFTRLGSLPEEIGQLKNLMTLDLSGQSVRKNEIEKIKKLLPNCEIITEREYMVARRSQERNQ